MAEERPDRNDEPTVDNLQEQDMMIRGELEGDDLFLTESLASLSNIQVPSGFVPGVMFRVYEKHHREKVTMPFIIVSALLLFLFSVIFFCLDVRAFAAEEGHSSFSQAFDRKLEILSEHATQVVSDLNGLFSATWQIISGAAGATSTTTLILLILGLVVLLYLIKKGLTALMG